MRCLSGFTLTNGNKRIIIRNTVVVISLEGNIDVLSPVCILKIRITEDVGIGAIKVHPVKTGSLSKPVREI